MGNDVAVNPDRAGLPEPFGPVRGQGLHWTDLSSGAATLDVAAVLRALREHAKLIAAATVAGVLLAILATLMTTPMYRADVTLEVNAPKVEILADDQRRNVDSAPTYELVATQVGLLASRSLAERVAQDLNLASNPDVIDQSGDPASRLRAATNVVAGGLRVEEPKDANLIRFHYVSPSPELAATVANGIADGFIESSLQRRYDASNYARNFLQQQIAKARGDLEKSERALVAYAQAQGIINTATGGTSGAGSGTPSDANSLQGESLIALNKALAEATARRVLAEGNYRQARLAGGGSEATGSTSGLRASRAALEAEYQEKLTLMKPDHPDMVALKSRIGELDRQINAEQSRVAGGQATSLLAEYRAALAAENALQARVNQLRGSVLDLRGRSIQYTILQREVDTNRSLYDALLQSFKEVGVTGGVGQSPVSIVDRAEIPGGPYKPNLMFNLLIGLLLGLLSGIALALALEFINDVIKSREDVRSKLGQACLGVVPKRRTKGSVVEDLQDQGSAISEAYSAIIAALRFSTESGAPKAVLVTSSMAAEGKSSTAFAIAQNYARRGESVLLIDSDLRRPVFKAHSNRQGLTKLLTNDEPLQAHLFDTQYDNLWLLPCGPTPPNPADLLSTPRFATILRQASAQFDRIVIDGPPVLGLADAPLLAATVENVVLVIEAGRTRTRSAREAIERLKTAGAHILGVALTKSTEEASHYGYRLYNYGNSQLPRDEIIMISGSSEGR
jgi:polysaccharide biosynthesis transport protein